MKVIDAVEKYSGSCDPSCPDRAKSHSRIGKELCDRYDDSLAEPLTRRLMQLVAKLAAEKLEGDGKSPLKAASVSLGYGNTGKI